MSVLQATGVYKSYESEGAPVRALRGLDFTLDDGEFVAIMGPSGCGKSTFLNLVAGLDTPSDGEIVLAGVSLSGKDENQLARIRRKHIGIVFQFFNLLEGMSVLENVTLPAVIAGMGRRQAESRARDLLDLLGLGDKARSAPGLLSGGQRQRLAIARALANQPTLLLADEPTGALDSEGGAEVLELFHRLHAEGQAILLVTHAVEVAEPADRIVHMRDGRVEATTVSAATAVTAGSVGPSAAVAAPAASETAQTRPQATGAAASAPPGTDPPASATPGTDPAASAPPATDPPASAPPGTDPATSPPPGTDPAASAPAGTDPATSPPPGTDPAVPGLG